MGRKPLGGSSPSARTEGGSPARRGYDARVAARVEELPENKVRLTVDVSSHDMQHAVEHAGSDLAATARIPGFRKGKVPMQVLLQRIGKERLYREAVESHIEGWFRNALGGTKIRPITRPEYDYSIPDSADEAFSFTATDRSILFGTRAWRNWQPRRV